MGGIILNPIFAVGKTQYCEIKNGPYELGYFLVDDGRECRIVEMFGTIECECFHTFKNKQDAVVFLNAALKLAQENPVAVSAYVKPVQLAFDFGE